MKPNRRSRSIVAMLVALACGLASYATTRLPGFPNQDFHMWWLAARAVLHGVDPYMTIWALPFHGFVYPLPAALATIPLAWMPSTVAGPLLIAVSCGALAYAITQSAWWPLIMFLSGSMILSVMAAQWSPLLTAALLVPAISWIGVLKPNIGLAILAYRPSAWTAAIMLGVALTSLLVMPTWPREWLSVALSSPIHFAPCREPGGALLLAAAVKWRRPEARLLLAFAVLPSSPIIYEALPLFVIPRSRVELLTLTISSNIIFLLMLGHSLQQDTDHYLAIAKPAMLWLMYFPALLMVLRRPNAERANECETRGENLGLGVTSAA